MVTSLLRFILHLTLIAIAVSFVAVAILIILSTESTPVVFGHDDPSVEDVQRIKQYVRTIRRNRNKQGDISQLLITERDFNLGFDYALSKCPHRNYISGNIDFYPDVVNVVFAFELPIDFSRRYLNVTMSLQPELSSLSIDEFRCGSLIVPDVVIRSALTLAHHFGVRVRKYRNLIALRDTIRDITITQDYLLLKFRWDEDVLTRLKGQGRQLLMDDQEAERIEIYENYLLKLSLASTRKDTSLSEILSLLFEFAHERTLSGNDPVEENQALLIALAFRYLNRSITDTLGLNHSNPPVVKRKLYASLFGRNDLAKHFCISAALAVTAGSRHAALVGVLKEIDDSKGGSGFSFADLAAAKAGIRFGEIAAHSRARARELQLLMAEGVIESDFMPSIHDLQEGLTDLQFENEFNDLESMKYQKVEDEINRRISLCRVYD